MRRLWYPAGVVVCTLLVYGYGVRTIGRSSGSAVFLALSACALLIGVGLLVRAGLALFKEPPATEVAIATGRRRKELEREKQSLLKALKELEGDHAMRKVSDADFAEMGGVYRARAIRVMRQLDDRQVDYAQLVEEELARHKHKAPIGARGPSSSAPERRPATVGPVARSPIACPGCGATNDHDAVFCKKCARRLAVQSVSS